jgi:hypothetical protein
VGGDPEDPAARLDIVLLGDGYVAGEVDLFASDAETFAGHLLSLEPFDAYTGLVAFWRVDRPSSESGVSHAETTPPVMKETAYGCAYGCGGIDRLVCCDDGRVLDDIGTHTPWADGALVLVNDATYGGSGGWSYAVAYNGSEGPRVGAHELAHSLIGLWDEYSYGTTGRQGDGPNCAFSAGNPPWAHWLDEPGIGAFPECTYTNYFRPSEGECLMYALQDRWCPVCREHIVHGIYEQLPRLLLAVEPAEGEVLLAVEEDTRFSFTALGPDAGLTAEWRLDGALVGTDEVLALRGCGREAARLELRVHDPTLWVRVDPNGLLVDEAAWTLAYASCPAEPQETGEEPAKRRGEPPRACGCASSVPFEAWGLLLAMLPLLGRARRATRG